VTNQPRPLCACATFSWWEGGRRTRTTCISRYLKAVTHFPGSFNKICAEHVRLSVDSSISVCRVEVLISMARRQTSCNARSGTSPFLRCLSRRSIRCQCGFSWRCLATRCRIDSFFLIFLECEELSFSHLRNIITYQLQTHACQRDSCLLVSKRREQFLSTNTAVFTTFLVLWEHFFATAGIVLRFVRVLRLR